MRGENYSHTASVIYSICKVTSLTLQLAGTMTHEQSMEGYLTQCSDLSWQWFIPFTKESLGWHSMSGNFYFRRSVYDSCAPALPKTNHDWDRFLNSSHCVMSYTGQRPCWFLYISPHIYHSINVVLCKKNMFKHIAASDITNKITENRTGWPGGAAFKLQFFRLIGFWK